MGTRKLPSKALTRQQKHSQVYAWGRSDFGQCGSTSESPLTRPQRIAIHRQAVSCPHGRSQVGLAVPIEDVAISENAICAVDCDGQVIALESTEVYPFASRQVWHWGAPLFGAESPKKSLSSQENSPQVIAELQGYRVLRIAAGKKHFAALAVKTNKKRANSGGNVSLCHCARLLQNSCG